MRNIKALAVTIALSITASWAQAGNDGGGGATVVCRNAKGKITSAVMADIFEGRNLYGLSYDSAQLSVNEWLAMAEVKLKSNVVVNNDYLQAMKDVTSKIVFLNSEVAVAPVNDANFKLKLKNPDCSYVWAANYTPDAGIIVDKEIYDSFDNLSKAAFLVHETIYKLNRDARKSEGTSDTARKITAYLLSDVTPSILLDLISEQLRRGNDKQLKIGRYEIGPDEMVGECNIDVIQSDYYSLHTNTVERTSPKYSNPYAKNCNNPSGQNMLWTCDPHTNKCIPAPLGAATTTAPFKNCTLTIEYPNLFSIYCGTWIVNFMTNQ